MISSPIVVKNASCLDALAGIPAFLGFQPRDSIVLCAIRPPRGRIGPVIRLDLDQAGVDGAVQEVLMNLRRVREIGAESVFAVRYAPADAPGLERDATVLAFLDDVGAVLPVEVLWDVTSTELREHHPRTGARLGPAVPAEALKSTRTAAAAVLSGMAPRACREDLARIDPAPPAACRAARVAERRASDQALSLGQTDLGRWRLAGLALWRNCLAEAVEDSSTPVAPTVLGRINALISDPVGRDAVMATPFRGAGDSPRQLALGLGGAAILDPTGSRGLDPVRAVAAVDLVTRVLAHVAVRRRGPGYALGASWHWWAGSGAEATEWARSALDCVNAPDLAALVWSLVDHGVFPESVVSRRC
jgi:hypothetical protein